jgi:hypothetical protein
LYAISIQRADGDRAVAADAGVIYQLQRCLPELLPEMFPTRTRVSVWRSLQNIGTAITALLPALFVAVAPPGATDIP